MNKRLFLLILALCLLMSGCAQAAPQTDTEATAIYRLSDGSGEAVLMPEMMELSTDMEPMEQIVQGLNSAPVDISLKSAFGENLLIESVRLEKGVVKVEMSPAYLLMNELERLLAESAVVLSFSALEEACYVEILCGEWSSGLLTEEKYALSDVIGGEYVRSMRFYLPNRAGTALTPYCISFTEDGATAYIQRLLEELFRSLGEGMENTSILSANIEDGVCRIDLSEEFYGAETADSGSGMLIIYSLVNSLCRLPGVNGVRISVEGIAVESYGGFATKWPLVADLSIVSFIGE